MFTNEEGGALPLAAGILILIILLGAAAVRLSLEEVFIGGLKKRSMEARYFSESLFGVAVEWFQEPHQFPVTGEYPFGGSGVEAERFLTRRLRDARGAGSFFDPRGVSQFQGSPANPDFLFHSEGFLGEALGGGWKGAGEISEVRIYGPGVLGALCGIEATVTLGKGVRHRTGAQLFPSPIPPPVAALDMGSLDLQKVPLRVHWGDIRVEGDADLGDSLEKVPVKDSGARLDGEVYGENGRNDRWIDIRVGGRIVNPGPAAEPVCPDCPRLFLEDGYPHVVQGEAAGNPGWGVNPWDYRSLKQFAKEWGLYYRPDGKGLLFGGEASGGGLRPLDVFSAGDPSSGSRFVFIDTLNGLPPDGSNLASLYLPVDYAKGIFSVYANLVIDPGGPGRDLDVFSPPLEGMGGGSEPVRLKSVHLNGILSVAGRLEIRRDFRLYGALRVDGGVGGAGEPEIWYNPSYESGMIPGLPTVWVKKGTWFLQ